MNNFKRITLFSGHYGSGKTNISVNFALKINEGGKDVTVYDMDIVNPYYRTLDAKSMLNSRGIRLVASAFANSNVDLPAVSGESYAMLHDKSRYAVVDIGGDDRGALVLGRFSQEIKKENNFQFIYVLNSCRPETSSIAGAKEIFDEIEAVAGIKFTAICSNANLMEETTKEVVLEGYNFAKEFGKTVNLPVLFVAVEESLAKKENFENINVLPIKLIKYLSFK